MIAVSGEMTDGVGSYRHHEGQERLEAAQKLENVELGKHVASTDMKASLNKVSVSLCLGICGEVERLALVRQGSWFGTLFNDRWRRLDQDQLITTPNLAVGRLTNVWLRQAIPLDSNARE
jgi:hypothetical protein